MSLRLLEYSYDREACISISCLIDRQIHCGHKNIVQKGINYVQNNWKYIWLNSLFDCKLHSRGPANIVQTGGWAKVFRKE